MLILVKKLTGHLIHISEIRCLLNFPFNANHGQASFPVSIREMRKILKVSNKIDKWICLDSIESRRDNETVRRVGGPDTPCQISYDVMAQYLQDLE